MISRECEQRGQPPTGLPATIFFGRCHSKRLELCAIIIFIDKNSNSIYLDGRNAMYLAGFTYFFAKELDARNRLREVSS